MNSIVDRLFPETGEPADLLLGIPDYSGGRAEDFLAGLSEQDREIMQHYLQNRIPPYNLFGFDAQEYVCELVKGYAIIDQDRTSAHGVEAAEREVERTKRYLEIFCESDGFFPWIRNLGRMTVNEDTGQYEDDSFDAWDSFATPSSIAFMQEAIKSRTLPYLDAAIEFIVAATSNSCFNQEHILSDYREAMASEQALLEKDFTY